MTTVWEKKQAQLEAAREYDLAVASKISAGENLTPTEKIHAAEILKLHANNRKLQTRGKRPQTRKIEDYDQARFLYFKYQYKDGLNKSQSLEKLITKYGLSDETRLKQIFGEKSGKGDVMSANSYETERIRKLVASLYGDKTREG